MNDKKKLSIINYQLLIILIACFFIAPISYAQYQLHIIYVDKDTSFHEESLKLQTSFANLTSCAQYVNKLPSQLNLKGYIAASVDSLRYDSSFATIHLYIGKQQHWIKLRADSIDKVALDESGFSENFFDHKLINISQLQSMQRQILNYYEKNGYPFAGIFLDSIHQNDEGMNAEMKVNKGPLYHIDSLRLYGSAKISNRFLQQYLGINNGDVYNIDKLQQISKKLANLSYLKEVRSSDLTMLGTGSILNLYLQPKKSSQVNFIIGFAPSNSQTGKLQLTGDADLNLKNSFGHGETILFSWQQLQTSSPRLDIGYQQPYVFKSPFGIDFLFDMFKKDSTYLQLNAQLGLQYLLSANQSGKIFLQSESTILLQSGVDTNQVIATKTLPPNIDVSAVNIGIDYKWNNTNYQFNPKTGNDLDIEASVGIKSIQKNSTILDIQDTSFNYASLYDSIKLHTYQFRVVAKTAHFFSTGKQSTLKTELNIGVFNSQDIFKNELFQIGGYKLLRGFDEESIYATQYAVATTEYRYLVGLNSYLFGFVDLGWAKDQYQDINVNTSFIGTGIGMEFETKVGLLNISYAIGKRSDVIFNLSEASKIHFGYVNYF
jgi:outer membrane protein assembly factor BamA